MTTSNLEEILNQYKQGTLSLSDALKTLKWYPFVEKKNLTFDTQRYLRRGFPEIIYAKDKNIKTLKEVLKNTKSISPLIMSRLEYTIYKKLKITFPKLKYNKTASIGYLDIPPKNKSGLIAVITAGSSDIKVGEEAAFTLELLGAHVNRFYDLGIAGLHRIMDKIEQIEESKCIIVAAGMEGALPGIIASMVSKPLIAVPTSIGYGTNLGGFSALLTMLNSCSLGSAVVNIDNGIGAATMAYLINKL
ncbi:MAG: nickel pincer cofactor biosynthesis protein LarB [Candidatus Saelkia tenebricola]|nr:nickel pincer cofactor biosynthesis protein LarB [Candidatus Saelkia tenebricola]